MLEPFGQTQLLQFWDELDEQGRVQLRQQIEEIDWARLDQLINECVLNPHQTEIDYHKLEPAPFFPLVPADPENEKLYAKAAAHGRALLRSGRVCGFTVAGGQGTRLGYDAPKGTYPISPIKGKSLFQLFAESLARGQEKYEVTIPWYIMTSPINDQATREFFSQNDFFGLNAADVHFFPQGTLPAIDYKGKVLLAQKDSIALSPNGHGGSLLALRSSGALQDMEKRGIDIISYWQVDNPLVKMLDPLFLGLHDIQNSAMSSRSLTKTGPFEKLGNFCLLDGKLVVIEYSDMPEDLAKAVDENGNLRFEAGSPAVHILKRQFVEELTEGGLKLPVHRADKKVAFVNDNGQQVQPEAANAVKLEMFIFDALPLAEQTLIVEMSRDEQFAPVKNATGTDSIETCRELMIKRAARWLEAAGIAVPRNEKDDPECVLELSPRRFLDVDDVVNAKPVLCAPDAGQKGYYD